VALNLLTRRLPSGAFVGVDVASFGAFDGTEVVGECVSPGPKVTAASFGAFDGADVVGEFVSPGPKVTASFFNDFGALVFGMVGNN